MSENQNLFIKSKYRLKKFLYFFYGEKFFKKIRYDWGKFTKRYEITKNNFRNREVHHHVFNKKLIYETLNYCDFEILDYLEKKEDLIVFCKNNI